MKKMTKARERFIRTMAGEPAGDYEKTLAERAEALERELREQEAKAKQTARELYPEFGEVTIAQAWNELVAILRRNPPDDPFAYVLIGYGVCLGRRLKD